MIFLKQIFSFFILTFVFSNVVVAQTQHHKSLLKADRFYEFGEYQLAEENYRKARESEKEIKSTFNLGNAVYKQDRFEEAIDHYTAATQLAPDNIQRSNAYFNLGNASFYGQKLEEAIDSYKEAIQLNPENQEAKYNLLVAKKILREAQQQQQENQEQQEGEQGEENQDQQEQQDQQEGEQGEENQEQQDQENQDQQEQQDSTNQNSDIQENAAFDTSRLDKQTLDSLDAMKLLQVIENEEKKVQEKLKKFNSNRKKPDKDW